MRRCAGAKAAVGGRAQQQPCASRFPGLTCRLRWAKTPEWGPSACPQVPAKAPALIRS